MATPKVSTSPKTSKRAIIDNKSARDQVIRHTLPPAGAGKANFNEIYNCPDPRPLFTVFRSLNYQIPQKALPLLERVLELGTKACEDGRPPKVLDVCCSYGINAALLRYQPNLEELLDHFVKPGAAWAEMTAMEINQQIQDDKTFFASHLKRPDITVVGLDTAANAIKYASQLNIIEDGWAENLEANAPSSDLEKGLSDVSVILCTGGVGYVGHSTFRRIIGAIENPGRLWIVATVLRIFSYDKIASIYDSYGLVTEKLDGVLLRQRRFASAQEQGAAMADVVARGLDPTGLESEGWFYAECYVTRPAKEAARTPLALALDGLFVPE